jgi:hypothetical protein
MVQTGLVHCTDRLAFAHGYSPSSRARVSRGPLHTLIMVRIGTLNKASWPRAYALNLTSIRVGNQHLFEKLRV